MAKIYDHNEFADTRTADNLEMYGKWVGFFPKSGMTNDRFYGSDFLENKRLEGVARCENFNAILLQRKRENFDKLSSHDKIDVLVARFDLVSISEHKPIEITKVAINEQNPLKKAIEFVPNEKAKVVWVERQMQKPKKVAKFIDRTSLF